MNESEEAKDQEEPLGETQGKKCKQKGRGKKRKRPASDSSSDEDDVLPENTLEMEKNLHASAIKNNLDDISVKKILKKVVTNDHVLALVKIREEEEDSSTEVGLRPKLTRAKAKELMKVSPKSAPWSNLELTPIKHIPVKTRPEVTALIAQELPDDEDDEEYRPTADDVPSDDDHVLESSSDVDSLPRTPASQGKSTPKVVNDGPFKVPQQDLPTPARRKLVLEEEEATIALRTRSKLSLSATSIEHIESSFVPPDELPVPDVDALWNDFLNDCLNPAPGARNEDDDETDPEYNVAADPDANEEDEETLENSIIKISKKELNDLVTELFSIMPDGADEQIADSAARDVLAAAAAAPAEVIPRWEGKQEPAGSDDENHTAAVPAKIPVKRDSNTRFSIGKSEPPDVPDSVENEQACSSEDNPLSEISAQQKSEVNSATVSASAPKPRKRAPPRPPRDPKQPPASLRDAVRIAPAPVRVELQKDVPVMTPEQLLLLQQQIRQHVQLATGCFLQLFVHPIHWARAPSYKDFLMSLNAMVEKNPASAANVCNLRPAVELAAGWEDAVSENTEDNVKMVEFIQKEVERSRRRSSHNALYVGDFPELFLQVVANSTVFLYPYLLPSMPFRPDLNMRRFNYLRSEDSLIAMGLDQFWDYVVSNPAIYKPRGQVHPTQRWGLSSTLLLVCKHMMPWLPARTLATHVHHCRKPSNSDNPIYKFFESRTVEPVRHKLLPFNPQLTLYEQPEDEMPRIWLRYLAKSSQRFKRHFFKAKGRSIGTPSGVDLELSAVKGNLKKTPLPIEFTRHIPCNRINAFTPAPEQNPTVNRIDLSINSTAATAPLPLIAKNIFTVVSTSNGSLLIPLQFQTKTVASTATPITTPALALGVTCNSDVIEGTRTAERSNPASAGLEHCSCCIVLRQICRERQRTIVEYFKRPREVRCGCKGRRYPRITNRLRLLTNNFKVHSQWVFRELKNKMEASAGAGGGAGGGADDRRPTAAITDDDEQDDLALATAFQLKIAMRTAIARNNMIKRKIYSAFAKFDPDTDDPVELARNMYRTFDVELVDLYKEFVGFLTAEQADRLGYFKDYFIQRCMIKLVRKIDEVVPGRDERCVLFTYLKSKFQSTFFHGWSACDICTALLGAARAHPALAAYIFSMFPHRQDESKPQKVVPPDENTSKPTECQASANYEADHSSSGEEEAAGAPLSAKHDEQYVNAQDVSLKVEEEEIDVVNTSTQKVDSNSEASEMSRLVMSDDEPVKSESPEWRREEDKVILEVLKEHLASQKRRDMTIDVLEETQVLSMIADSLPQKSTDDVKERILYLLQLLVSGDK